MSDETTETNLYRVTPLFPQSEEQEAQGQQFYLKGSLRDKIVVSIPETCSQAAAYAVRNAVEKRYEGSDVLVISHNVEFLAVEPVPFEDRATALSTIKEAEDVGEDPAVVAIEEHLEGNGGGSRFREHRGDDT